LKVFIFKPIPILLSACILSFLLAMPRLFFYMKEGTAFKFGAWEAMYKKANDLTDNLDEYPPTSNAAKRVFRLTMPLAMKLTGKPPAWAIYCFQLGIGFLLLYLFYLFGKRFFSPTDSLIIAATLPFLYYGRSMWVDIYSWFDTFAYFFLFLGIYFRQNPLKWLCFFAAFWTDERALLAYPVFLLWENRDFIIAGSLKKLLNRNTFLLMIPVFGYSILRIYLGWKFNMQTPSADASLLTVKNTISNFTVANLSFFEGFWLAIILMVWGFIRAKNHLGLIFIFLVLLSQTMVAHMVYDTTRSGSYWFPLVLLPLYFIKNSPEFSKDFSLIVRVIFWSTFLIPGFYVLGEIQYLHGMHEEILVFIARNLN
jgi:hypothetical protein